MNILLYERIIPVGIRIMKSPGICVISINFANRWNSFLKITDRCLVELLQEEKKK